MSRSSSLLEKDATTPHPAVRAELGLRHVKNEFRAVYDGEAHVDESG